MTRKIFRFAPGMCICTLEFTYRNPQHVNVLRASRLEALIESVTEVKVGDCISVSLKLNSGIKIPLLARVKSIGGGGILLKWLYNQPHEEAALESTFSRFVAATRGRGAQELKPRPATQRPPAPQVQKRSMHVPGEEAARNQTILSRALTVRPTRRRTTR